MSSLRDIRNVEEIECHFKWKPCEGDVDSNPKVCIEIIEADLDSHCDKTAARLLIGYLHTQTPSPSYKISLSIFDQILNDCKHCPVDCKESYDGYKLVATANKIHVLRLTSESEKEDELLRSLDDVDVTNNKTLACVKAISAAAFRHFNLVQNKKSLKLYEEAVNLDPDNPHWKIGLAFMMGRVRRRGNDLSIGLDEEKRLLREAIIQTHNTNFLPILMLAELLSLQGTKNMFLRSTSTYQHSEAMTLFKRAYKLNPQSGYVLTACGKAFSLIGEKSLGEKCLLEAIKLDPKNSTAMHRLGQCYKSYKNDLEMLIKAEKVLDKAVTAGRRRHFYAELNLADVRKLINPKYDCEKHYMNMKKYYIEDEGRINLLEKKITTKNYLK